MRPTTSAAIDCATSSNEDFLEPNILSGEDCRFLLRALEKQAFEYVICAFRAQGPLTEYKELLLEHIKSALFIADEEFTLHCRIAANNPYLTRIAQELNPSYDNFSEWIAAGFDLTGVDLARTRMLASKERSNSSNMTSRTSQILKEIRRHNTNLPNEDEQLANLYRLPKRPYVPERLRRFLQDTESDLMGRIDVPVEKTISTLSGTSSSSLQTTKSANKTGVVGRPKKNRLVRNAVVKPTPTPAAVLVDKEQNSSYTSSPQHTKRTVENNSSSRKRPTIPLDLTQSSAQISQQEAAEKLMREHRERLEQCFGGNAAEMEGGASSTSAMDSLAEAALAQVPVEIVPFQLPPMNLPALPMMNISTNCLPLSMAPLQDNAAAPSSQTTKQYPMVNVGKPENCEVGMNSNRLLMGNSATMTTLANLGSNNSHLKSPKKKHHHHHSSKHHHPSSFTSARVRPFVFEKAAAGQPKPPRGNPDSKPQTAQPMDSSNLEGSSSATFPALAYPLFNASSKYYNNQSPQVRGGVAATNALMMMNNANNDHSYDQIGLCCPSTSILAPLPVGSGTILPTAALVEGTSMETTEQTPELIVLNTISASSAQTKAAAALVVPATKHLSKRQKLSHLVHQQNGAAEQLISNGTGSVKTTCRLSSTLASTSASSSKGPLITDGIPRRENNAVEPSGLDFLASTAVMLAPMETEEGSNNHHQQQNVQ